jgi:putative transposase
LGPGRLLKQTPEVAARCIITDEVWTNFGPMVEHSKSRLRPGPDLADCMFSENVLYWARVGCPWRDLPSEFGVLSAVSNRLHRWIASGRLKHLFELMVAQRACEGFRRVMIDSTIVRAHQHSAGVLKERGRRGPGARPALDEGHRRRVRPPPTRSWVRCTWAWCDWSSA